jgi:hypothetical protein
MTATQSDLHPIGLIVNDDLHRNRLTVFFRLLLAIPQSIVIGLWGIVVYFAVIVAWFAALFTGRVPDGLHEFIAKYVRAATHLRAYVLLLANPWPPFGGAQGTYPVDVRVDPPAKQSRLTVFFRTLLAIPAILLYYVFGIVNNLIAFLGWFVCIVTGRMPQGMRDLSAWMLGYETQTLGYLMLLTDRYPSFSGGPSA